MVSSASATPILSPESVFPGPRAFQTSEAALFFGRDREAAQLTDLLLTYQDVLLYAQSGAGKTSLINARVVEKLGAENYHVARVGGQFPPNLELKAVPNIFVYNLIASTVKDPGQASGLVQATLEEYFKCPPDCENSFLIIDQLEEVFKTYPERWEDRRPFFEHLRSLLKQNPELHLLLAIREDYLAPLEYYADLFPNQLRIRYYLQTLREEPATDAIEKPLQAAGTTLDSTQTKTLVDSLRTVPVKTPNGLVKVLGEFVEPLHLQVVCQNLVTELQQGATKISSERLATLTDVDEALADFYDRAIAAAVNVSKVPEAKIRRWFDSVLITPAGTRAIVFQGDQDTAGLENEAVLELARQNIIRGELRAGAQWYELTHDRFIEPIRKSNAQWREARGEAFRIAQQLEAKATAWDQGGRRNENLLSDSELQHALQAGNDPNADLSKELTALVAASQAEIQAKQERQRLLEAQASSARRFRNLAIVSVTIAAVAVMILIWGYRQQVRLKSVRLATAAVNLLKTEPDHSVLLAMYALSASNTPQAVDALNHSLHELHLEHTLTGHTDKITALAYSPDASLLATASMDQTIRIWDTANWTTSRTYSLPGYQIIGLKFMQDGKRLVSAASHPPEFKDSLLQLWDVSESSKDKPVASIQTSGAILALAYSVPKHLVATVEGLDGTVHLWSETKDGLQEVAHWSTGSLVLAADFSISGSALATGGQDKVVRLWSLSDCMKKTGKCQPFLELKGNTDKVMGVAFSPDGQYVASAGMDRSIHIWNGKGENLHTISDAHANTVFAVAFDEHGRLVSASADGRAKVWDPASAHELLGLMGHTQPIEEVAFSPDGNQVATGSWDHSIKIWSTIGHSDRIEENAFTHDGKILATGGRDKVVLLWNPKTLQETEALPEVSGKLLTVTISDDDKLLAAVAEDKISIWDMTAKSWIVELPASGTGTTAAFEPHSSEVAAGYEDGRVLLWQPKPGVKPRRLGTHKYPIAGLAFTPDGNWVASAANEDPIELWSTKDPKATHCFFSGENDYVNALTFSPDGKTLASGTVAGTVRLWDVATCKLFPVAIHGHSNLITELSFSPNGKQLATASWDGTVRVWNVATGQENTRFELGVPVDSVAFSPDGTYLAIASQDSVPRLYYFDKKHLMQQAHQRMRQLGATLTPDECKAFFDSASCPPEP